MGLIVHRKIAQFRLSPFSLAVFCQQILTRVYFFDHACTVIVVAVEIENIR